MNLRSNKKESIFSILKISILKIILSLILVILFVPFIKYFNGIECIKAPCPNENMGTILQYINHFTQYGLGQLRYFNLSAIREINYLILIIGLALSYFISCLIVFIFNKLRKR